MFSLDLFIAKIICGLALTACSFAGALLPLYVVKSCRNTTQHGTSRSGSPKGSGNDDEQQQQQASSMSKAENFISVGNATSAGLLLGAGLLHFLPSSITDSILLAAGSQSSASSNGTVNASLLLNASNMETVEAAIVHCCILFVVGLLVPAFVDGVLLSSGTNGAHGHSHGAVLDDHPHQGINIDGSAASPTSTAGGSGQGSKGNVLMLAILLSVHCVMEGMMLGVEDSTTALRTTMVALTVHKFFDGVVMGLALARRSQSEGDQQSSGSPTGGRQVAPPPGLIASALRNKTLMFWLCVTPVSMLIFAITNSNTESPSEATSGHDHGGHSHGAPGPFRAAVQGVGAGSFVYLALELLNGELKAVAAPGGATSLHKFVCAIVGFGAVMLMESDHHH